MRHKEHATARIAVIAVTVVVALLFCAAAITAKGNAIDDKLTIIGCIIFLAAAVIIPAWTVDG